MPQEGLRIMKYPRRSETEYLLAFGYLVDCVAFARVIVDDPTVDCGDLISSEKISVLSRKEVVFVRMGW